jgi:hypothetical protein
MVVERVSAGVAPPEEDPANPFAEDTDTAVTVPVLQGLPVVVKSPPVPAWRQLPLVSVEAERAVVEA